MRVFDCELWLPGTTEPKPGMPQPAGPSGPHRTEPLEGYGWANYDQVFKKLASTKTDEDDSAAELRPAEYAERSDELVRMMDEAGVRQGLLTTVPNEVIVDLVDRHPERFRGFVTLSPFDGMRAVRRFEEYVREEGISGLHIFSLYDDIPASDRRYYPLYAKCVELDVPVRIYSAMTFANDRPYDLGHPRHLDQVASDFPELRIVAGLGGWPWVPEMIALVRRHPNLYVDTGSHRPKYFPVPGSGWEMLMQYGNTVLQDKIMVGLSWSGFGISMREVVEEYAALPLREHVIDKWLYVNAETFFRL